MSIVCVCRVGLDLRAGRLAAAADFDWDRDGLGSPAWDVSLDESTAAVHGRKKAQKAQNPELVFVTFEPFYGKRSAVRLARIDGRVVLGRWKKYEKRDCETARLERVGTIRKGQVLRFSRGA